MRNKIRQVREIVNHPANRSHRTKALIRYLKWNIGRRLLNEAEYVISIEPGVRVILSNEENYATLAYTCGLYDFEEMRFLKDYLRPGDVFADFGANVGLYSMIAGSVGAQVLAVEPVPTTFAKLKRNIALNSVSGSALCAGLSDANGFLRFTSLLGGLNRVARNGDGGDALVEVEVLTGDEAVRRTGLKPQVLKIDVEGFELPVLKGSRELLKEVVAVIVELNGSGRAYGYSDNDVHRFLRACGFERFDYRPHSRDFAPGEARADGKLNGLYLRFEELESVSHRVSCAPGAHKAT